ncbi:MAG: DUF4276 family protein [Bryobacteraceae bacterium]
MIRLHAVVEGQTEETFVNNVLAPELGPLGVGVDAHRVTTGRMKARTFRGGLLKYSHLRKDLDLWMRQDSHPESWFTSMIDLYALPDDFPGYGECSKVGDPVKRVECLEAGFAQDIAHRQFIPYIQLHEFEALLFAEPRKFNIAFPGETSKIDTLLSIRDEFPSPEHIDDGSDTAPSKRILQVYPDYKKTVAGPEISAQIGMATLRRECSHFDGWIRRIEHVAKSNA